MADSNINSQIDTLMLDPSDEQYIEELRDRLIELLAPFQTIDGLESGLRKLHPDSELINMAIKAVNESRMGLQKNHRFRHLPISSGATFTGTLHNITSFAVAKVSNLVRDGVAGSRNENELSKFKMALIEYIISDVLKLAGNFVRSLNGNFIITRSDIRTAMHADKELMELFLSDDRTLLITQTHPILARINDSDKASQNIINFNQEPHLAYKQKVRNMIDSENSFIRGLKLITKVFKAHLEKLPFIRREVDIIFCNIEEILELSTLLLTAFEDAIESVGQEDEIPYVGSEILDLAQAEEFHAYFNFAHRRLSGSWRRAYNEIILNETTMTSIRTAGQPFDLAVKHLLPNYLLNTLIQFFEYFKNISELYELSKRLPNRDDQLTLKETISILIKTKRAIEELLKAEMDREEIEPLESKQAESIRTMLERQLDVELQHERNKPLPYMPPPEIYRFSEPDSKDNIQFEDFQTISSRDSDKSLRANETNQIPVIRCATLIKLVERLTYHKYQPNIVDSFLTTYRSFISDPEELLDLLIERFKIPDPPLSVVFPNYDGPLDDLHEKELTIYKQYLKRFRQEYSKPVKMRVINVLKSWIKNHYYDFERHSTLLDKLLSFLDEVSQTDKVLKSLIDSIKKSIDQKKISQRDEFEFMLSEEPPPIRWLKAQANEAEKFDILTLDPVEFARQLTLIEFDLFRAIKPSELINVRDLGLRTRKDDKYETSPNLSKMTRHFTLLSYWVRKCIVETEDFDKRSVIYARFVEIMQVLGDFNNFTGLLSIGSAIESAPIARLSHTKKSLTNTPLKNVLDDYRDLTNDHQKKLQRKLRQCNPPCIPYLGSYQTKLIHAKEGNKTFIDEVDTTSPTLSNDEIHSSFSNSPATPISPRTPLPRSTNLPSASSTIQNQFFGGSLTLTRPLPIKIVANNNNNNNTISGSLCNNSLNLGGFCGASGEGSLGSALSHSNSSSTITQSSFLINQPQLPPYPSHPPSTPAPPKMINFTKQRIRAGLVAEISNYQNPPYCLSVQPEIRQFIVSIETEMVKFASSLMSQQQQQQPKHGDSNGCAEVSVPAMTKRLDDYLFEQSERIEPKNSKPPRPKSKLPDFWKSTGTKVNNCSTPR